MGKRYTSFSSLNWADSSGQGGSTWTNHDCLLFRTRRIDVEKSRLFGRRRRRRSPEKHDAEEKKRKTRSRLLDDIPDECLANVFEFLDLIDRQNCSLVCHRWLYIEGQSRRRLCIDARKYRDSWDVLPLEDVIPSLLTRFDSLTSLALNYVKVIGDDDLLLISLRCRNLTRLKLRGCRYLTDAGVVGFAVNCKGLKGFHAQWCQFGAKAINAIVDHSSFLEDLSALTLGGLVGYSAAARSSSSPIGIGPALAASSLKNICIGQHLTPNYIHDCEYYTVLQNAQCFVPLIIASKNLRTLKICGSYAKDCWDKVFQAMVEQQVTGLVEIQLTTRFRISDAALLSISNFYDLEMLHLADTENCTNAGLAYIASGCKRLRRLRIQNRSLEGHDEVGDEGIFAIAKGCPKLEELFLMQVDVTCLSLNMLAENCPNLESLALCWNDTTGDAEMTLIAAKFIALKYLNIYGCEITDEGVLALSSGCPNLVHLEIAHCLETTLGGLNRLKAKRDCLFVNYHHPCDHHAACPPWADRALVVCS